MPVVGHYLVVCLTLQPIGSPSGLMLARTGDCPTKNVIIICYRFPQAHTWRNMGMVKSPNFIQLVC
ncbi:hypothetical protein BDV06DRAFT_182395 [Aspergillus oleicola]